MNFEILKTAGISKLLFAQLLGVTHGAVGHWISGRCVIHPLRVKKVERVLAAIKHAVEAGDLPTKRKAGLGISEYRADIIKKHLDAPQAKRIG